MKNEGLSSSPENWPTWTPALHTLLQGMRNTTDLDFSRYSRSSVTRRIGARMQRIGQADLRAYADYCRNIPEEYAGLAETILITATSFFRDPFVWDGLGDLLLSRLPARRPLRFWCAGCASGEEAYTLAIVMAEALGLSRPNEGIQIEATDIALPALERARRGCYSTAQINSVPSGLRERYYTRTEDGWAVRAALRETVQFRRHDLAKDTPPNEIDFISCRNTLMYFGPALQTQVLTGMARVLTPGGGLFLGRAEGIRPGIKGFALWDQPRRLYKIVS